MLDKLLEYAAQRQLTIGFRVRPMDNGFGVSIWIGPDTGERSEWQSDFDRSMPRLDAIMELSEEVYQALTLGSGDASKSTIHLGS